MKTIKMRLGDIEERRDLNPRGHLKISAMQDYVRLLRAGEKPPPLKVCARTRVLLDGAHTLHAMKEFIGSGWENHETEVVLLKDLPDPVNDPARWRKAAMEANKYHGVQVSRFDRRSVLAELAVRYGVEEALAAAGAACETRESVEELLGLLRREHRGGIVVESGDVGGDDVAAADTGMNGAAGQEGALPEAGVGQYRPEGSVLPGRMLPLTPYIRRLCRELRAVLAGRTPPLLDVDRAELAQTAAAITAALARGEAAA